MRPVDSERNDQKLANRTKTYGPPRLQAILQSGLVRLRQRIRSQTIGPGQDGDSRVPLLINFTASKRHWYQDVVFATNIVGFCVSQTLRLFRMQALSR